MFLEITVAGVTVFVLWVFSKSIKAHARNLEDKIKTIALEDAVERAPELVRISKELDELGDIPNLDNLLDRAHGKQKPTAKSDNTVKVKADSKANQSVA